jgi:hypothetical protein
MQWIVGSGSLATAGLPMSPFLNVEVVLCSLSATYNSPVTGKPKRAAIRPPLSTFHYFS